MDIRLEAQRTGTLRHGKGEDYAVPDQPPARPLLLATHNSGKLRELRQLIDPGWALVAPEEADLGHLHVVEDGATYRENAALKARAFADASGLPALADDSGLEVDALDGAPGIRSARYARAGATDAANRARLVAALEGVPGERRKARYRALVAIALPRQSRVWCTEGIVAGSIAIDERGSEGFGYDPLFELPDGRRMAELTMEEKNQISHRARALRAAAPLLARLLREQSR